MAFTNIKTIKQLMESILLERKELRVNLLDLDFYEIHMNEIYYRALLHKNAKNNMHNFFSDDIPKMKFYGMDVVLNNEIENYEIRRKT